MEKSKGMYKEHILDLYRNPLNYHEMESHTHTGEGKNPACGDNIKLFLNVENGIIKKASFTGSSCAICKASSSLVTNLLHGKNLKEATEIKAEDVLKLLGIRLHPMRMRCALLSLEALKNSLDKDGVN